MATLTMNEQVSTEQPDQPGSSSKPVAKRGGGDLSSLITESPNTASHGLDTKSALEIARIINQEDG